MTGFGDIPNLNPLVKWAQRSSVIYITICLEDCAKPNINLEENKLQFRGVGGAEQQAYGFDMVFMHPIDPEQSTTNAMSRCIEMTIAKKNPGPYWTHLTLDGKRLHWLKVDFNRWRDEEDSEEGEPDAPDHPNNDLEEMMRQMGGLGGGDPAMPGFRGDMNAGDRPNFNDLEAQSDSDDEGMPDLE